MKEKLSFVGLCNQLLNFDITKAQEEVHTLLCKRIFNEDMDKEIEETISSIYGKDYDIVYDDDVSDLFWELMESVALEHGMDYFEDYPFEVEFKNKGE